MMADLRGEFADIAHRATSELEATLERIAPESIEILLDMIRGAGSIATYGVGREGLAMKGLAMRLYHIGLKVSVVGEMTASALGAGDVLLLSAGPGYFSTAAALAKEAKKAGAQVVAFTSKPPHLLQLPADLVVQLPATCLPATDSGNDEHSTRDTQGAGASAEGQLRGSALPMGSSYELALQLFFDVLCMLLQRVLDVPEDAMRHRHTNME